MHFGRKSWLGIGLAIVLIAVAFFGVERYRYRFVHSNADLLKLLPTADFSYFFADLDTLRRSGYLELLATAKRGQDKDYSDFVRATGFDYTKDLDALAGASDGRQFLFALRGRFSWSKLHAYARAHGGSCREEVCTVATSTPGRWASFRPIQPDVMALGTGPATALAGLVGPANSGIVAAASAPVWLRPARSVLSNPSDLPIALRIFAISLQSSDSLVLSLAPATSSDAAFEIQLDARCRNAATADTAKNQLVLDSKMLALELAREHQTPNPADLTGLLTSGTFTTVNQHVAATWPVRKELLASIQ